jgi:hypothetical protein
MTPHIPENFWLVDWSLATIMDNALPPRDPKTMMMMTTRTKKTKRMRTRSRLREPDDDEYDETGRLSSPTLSFYVDCGSWISNASPFTSLMRLR